jgi:hypothetical protein
LIALVKEYPAAEVLSELIAAFREHRDNLSDLGIKDKAKEYSEIAELVGEIRDVLEDAGH